MINIFCEDTGMVFFLNLGVWNETRSSVLSGFTNTHPLRHTMASSQVSCLFPTRMCGDKILFLDESR